VPIVAVFEGPGFTQQNYEESVRKFGDKLVPILREVGVEGQPEVYPAHTVVTAK
jgi:hypothetical protein